MPMPGGYSEPSKDINLQVQQVADEIKPILEEKLDRQQFDMYKLLEFREQVVAGMIYNFKIQISVSECVHVKVFKPLPHEHKSPEIQACELHSLEDPLEIL
jgi:hypothetical protein